MEEVVGKVTEVYTNEENTKVGYKILLNNGKEFVLEEKQEDINTNIFRDDIVAVRKTILYGKVFYDIELFYGDKNE